MQRTIDSLSIKSVRSPRIALYIDTCYDVSQTFITRQSFCTDQVLFIRLRNRRCDLYFCSYVGELTMHCNVFQRCRASKLEKADILELVLEHMQNERNSSK